VTVVSTLSVLHSWQGFASTTTMERFTAPDGRRRIAERLEVAQASVRAAHAVGVPVAAGSDFGGGSVRAGHLAREVEGLVRAGLEPWNALGAATWRGGDVLGDPHAGRLAVGSPAHFTLVHGDPAAIWRVWRVS
jgi:imidazolonepropionase-like amidohydrolase